MERRGSRQIRPSVVVRPCRAVVLLLLSSHESMINGGAYLCGLACGPTNSLLCCGQICGLPQLFCPPSTQFVCQGLVSASVTSKAYDKHFTTPPAVRLRSALPPPLKYLTSPLLQTPTKQGRLQRRVERNCPGPAPEIYVPLSRGYFEGVGRVRRCRREQGVLWHPRTFLPPRGWRKGWRQAKG